MECSSAQKFAANLVSGGPGKCPQFVDDVKPARRLKRGRTAEHNSDFNSFGTTVKRFGLRGYSDIDEEYEMFSNSVIGYMDCHVASVDEDGDDIATGFTNEDYQRKLFFDNLNVQGRSYTLEWQENDGTMHIVKYEDPDNLDPLERDRIDRNRVATSTSLSNIAHGETIRKPKFSKKMDVEIKSSLVGKSTSTKVRKHSKLVSDSKRNHNLTKQKSIPDICGRCYLRFLSNLRIDDESRVYTSNTGEIVRYDEGHVSCSKRNSKLTKQKSVPGIGNSYSRFLSNLRIDNGSVVFTTNTGDSKVVRYDEKSSSGSNINVMGRDPHHGRSRAPYPNIQSGTICKNAGYKENLMSLLQRPYSREEYDDLWRKASYQRKRKREVGELSRSRKHKSYLDKYPVLKQKIGTVRRDRPRVLNLLRGFFYWLQRVPEKEDLLPWLEPSCLEVMPIIE